MAREMRKAILISGLVIAIGAGSARAQQPAARPPADSTRPPDSTLVRRELERLRAEPRVPPTPPAPPLVPVDTGAALRLTRAAAVGMALAGNPTILAAREQVLEAGARKVQATQIPFPTVTGAIVGQTNAFRPGTGNEHDVGVGLTIPFPDRLRLQGRVAQADVSSAEFAYTQQRQLIASQTAQVYDSLLVALRHGDDLRTARQLAQEFLTRTEARFNAGTAPRLDVLRAKVDLSRAENDLIANERDVANARAGLNRLLGRTLGAGIEPADSLAVPATPAALPELEQRALAVRPELRSLAAQRRGASAARALANEYWVPDVSLGVSRQAVDGVGASYETDVGLAFPLFFWQHSRGEVAEAAHREAELAATNRDLAAQIGQEVRTAWAAAVTALRQALYLRDALLPEVEQAYRSAAASYSLGGSSALEVLQAQRDLLDARSQYTDALGAANDAAAQLALAVGAPLDSTTTGGSRE